MMRRGLQQFSLLLFQGEPPVLLTGYGAPIANKTASLTVGPRGPVLLQDYVYLDEMSHFDRERIPERVVHAKGAGNLFIINRCKMSEINNLPESKIRRTYLWMV